MEIHVYGKLDEEKLTKIVDDVSKKLFLSNRSSIHFVDSTKDCKSAANSLPKKFRKEAYRLCTDNIPFAHPYRNDGIIVVPLEKDKFSNMALKGLIFHEMIHIAQLKKGMYKNIDLAFEKAWKSKQHLFEKLDYNPTKLANMLIGVGKSARLLLKELHANSELINSGCGRYLVDFYLESFGKKKVCPRPVFYKKFKIAAKKDLQIIQIAFEFEFALLSILLPFEKLESKRAKKLVKHIDSCYRINTQEISRKCGELVTLYLDGYGKKNFDRIFFSQILDKVYYLLR